MKVFSVWRIAQSVSNPLTLSASRIDDRDEESIHRQENRHAHFFDQIEDSPYYENRDTRIFDQIQIWEDPVREKMATTIKERLQ